MEQGFFDSESLELCFNYIFLFITGVIVIWYWAKAELNFSNIYAYEEHMDNWLH